MKKMSESQVAYNQAMKALDEIKNIQAKHICGKIGFEDLAEDHRFRETTSDARTVVNRLCEILVKMASK